MRQDILEQHALIEKWAAERRPKAFMCRELSCRPSTLNGCLAKMRIEYTGNRGGKGQKFCPTRKHAQEFLRMGSTVTSHKLRLRLIEDGLKERCCERCSNTEWMGEPVPLELHHINGNRFDNRIENLQMLCPNCHTLTDNNAGKGIAK